MSKTYTFFGRVYPERVDIRCTPLHLIGDPIIQKLGELEIKIDIAYSQIAAQVSKYPAEISLDTLANTVGNLARAIVDTIGYQNGCGYEVEITSAINEDGEQVVFGVQGVSFTTPIEGRALGFDELQKFSLSNVAFRRALGELRHAVRNPEDTAFHGWRAVEAIMQHFKTTGNEALAWQNMGNNLLIESSWTDDLRKSGGDLRHGALKDITPDQRKTFLTCAWRVVDRFVLYLSKGERPLDRATLEKLV